MVGICRDLMKVVCKLTPTAFMCVLDAVKKMEKLAPEIDDLISQLTEASVGTSDTSKQNETNTSAGQSGTGNVSMPAKKKAFQPPQQELEDPDEETISRLSKEHAERGKLINSFEEAMGCTFKNIMVAELVKDKQLRYSEGAVAAADKEWGNLEKRECWKLDQVVRWKDVVAQAAKEDKIIHIGSLCELVYLKGSELPEGNPGRKMKGRVVFLGDRVRDQFGAAAIFEELSSSPAGMGCLEVLRCLW